MFPSGPQPFEGAPGDVVVKGYPMMIVRDQQSGEMQYEVRDPERFADKMSIGDLRYGDFNPYENAHAVGHFDGGYGLDRLSDLNDENLGIGVVKESPGVDCRFGPAILASLVNLETLPFTVPAVWMGEFTPSTGSVTGAHWVAIGGTKVAYRNAAGTWTDTGLALAANAVQGAVTIVNGFLIIGYGASHTAQYITALDGTSLANVADTGPNNLFIFAATTDRAAVYIAGGTSASNSNTILSSAVTAGTPPTAFGLAASAIATGGTDRPITALAPGGGSFVAGGNVLLFIGNTKELGAIVEVVTAAGTVAVYLVLLPFDSSLSTNCQGMRWWQGTSAEEQRGPTILVFGRDRSPWSYAPASASAANIAAWAIPGYNPPNIQGRATCFQGTARWLYYAITRSDGHSYLLCRDSRAQQSGSLTQGPLITSTQVGSATHSLLDLGVNACQALGITSLFGNPTLFFGTGSNISNVVLPLDGENPLHDSSGLCRFGSSGTLTIPDIDHNFPDEDKVEFVVRMVHDNVNPGAQDIQCAVSVDGGPFVNLGNAQAGNGSSVSFLTSTVSKRITPRFTLTTTDPTKSPILRAFSVRASINPLLYKEWLFVAEPNLHQMPWGGDDLGNVYILVNDFWNARKTGLPFTYIDRWGDNWVVRLLRFGEKHIKQEHGLPPQVQCSFQLLLVAPGAGNSAYGNQLARYGTAKYG